jgi:hypothetical protein
VVKFVVLYGGLPYVPIPCPAPGTAAGREPRAAPPLEPTRAWSLGIEKAIMLYRNESAFPVLSGAINKVGRVFGMAAMG